MSEVSHLIKTDFGMHKDGAFFCANMRKGSNGGILADYSLANFATKTASTKTANLSTILGWAQREYGSQLTGKTTTFGKDSGGRIFAIDKDGSAIHQCLVNSKTDGVARGIATDPHNEVVISSSRYLGRTVTSTLDGAIAIDATEVDVADATGFPASGYIFIKDNLGGETLQYTGISTNQLTGVTRGKYNTTAATHATGKEVIAFDDDWKDLGANQALNVRPIIKSEDTILVGNVNTVAGYSESDGSDWDTAKLTLPSDCDIVDFSEILTGSGLRIIIAANRGARGSLFIWDREGGDEWEREIPLEENIQRLHKTYVGLATGVYETDGYGISLVKSLPDDDQEIRSADFDIQDIKSKGNFLLITANNGQFDRNRSGLWVLDLTNSVWYYILPSNYASYGTSYGAIFISSSWQILIGTNYNEGAVDSLTTTAKARGNYYQIIYDPQARMGGNPTLLLKQLKLDIDNKLKQYYNNNDLDFEVIARVYDFKRPFLQYAQTSAASSAKSEIVISSALGVPEVGDRVEIISRSYVSYSDVAGAPRNVTAVVAGTGKYTITLDDDLPALIDASTGTAVQTLLINPLKKIQKIEVDDASVNLKELIITAKDQQEYKKLIIEIEFRCNDTGIAPRLNSIEVLSEVLNR